MFEKMEKPTKIMTIIIRRPMIYRTNRKKRGAPGPKNENCIG
jgi:hypothetical protein